MKSDPLPDSVTWSTNTNQSSSGWDSGSVTAPAAVVTDKWKSCAICLEELEDSELLCHTVCGGTFCQSCLEVNLFSLLICHVYILLLMMILYEIINKFRETM